MALIKKIRTLLLDKRILWLLVVVNFLGSVYGFYWYHQQLAVTAWYWWPWVPDSPFASSLFTLFLLFLIRRKYYPGFAVWALLSSMKYGIWAAIINLNYWQLSGHFYPENLMLTVSHLGMAGEGLFYLLIFRFSRRNIVWTGVWFAVNDGLDYLVGIHPYLFSEDQYTLAWTSIVILSGLLLYLSWSVRTVGTKHICNHLPDKQ